jgi:ribosomal protein L11 methyltransferase
VPPEQAEPARAVLLAHSPAGLEEVEANGLLELSVYVPAADEVALRELLERDFGEVLTRRVDDGWEHRWRSFHRPVVAGGLWIGPPWETAPAGVPAVSIEPGLAFGTGAHPTTRLCVELLDGQPRGSLLDVGCGSGVLAIAGVRLGFQPVIAIDLDPVAVEVTIANAAANGARVEVELGDARVTLPPADVVVANLTIGLVDELLGHVNAKRAVTSGYPVGEHPEAPDWELLGRRGLDGWAADLFERQ